MAIAFLGPRGTFSEEAALIHAGKDADMVAVPGIPALVSAVETGLAEVAVLPIENSIEGPISTTLDLLIHETGLLIQAEVVVPIRQVLVTAPGATLDGIQTVLSHPQGLAQCRRFLERFLPQAEKVAWMSTAGAVQEVVEGNDLTRAAIGPYQAHELYGGQVLARDIQDIRGNLTRFVVLAPEDAAPTGNDKTSIAFTVKENVPGILFKVFQPFANRNIQLTKIESRPIKGRLGLYVFLVDFEGHKLDPEIAQVLDEVRDMVKDLKVFGSYPKFPLEQFDELFETRALL
jgi:prephenate dehydratase